MNKVNLNDYVWAELTEYGWKCLEYYYEKTLYPFAEGFKPGDYLATHKKNTALHTIDGVERALTRFQWHEFMLLLGSTMYVGNTNVVEGNNLYFNLE